MDFHAEPSGGGGTSWTPLLKASAGGSCGRNHRPRRSRERIRSRARSRGTGPHLPALSRRQWFQSQGIPPGSLFLFLCGSGWPLWRKGGQTTGRRRGTDLCSEKNAGRLPGRGRSVVISNCICSRSKARYPDCCGPWKADFVVLKPLSRKKRTADSRMKPHTVGHRGSGRIFYLHGERETFPGQRVGDGKGKGVGVDASGKS